MPSPLANFFMKSLINSPLHFLLGENFAVITVTGRKTGKPIATPVNTLHVDGILTVLSQRDRTWWRNLRGGRMAQLRRAGKLLTVRGEAVEAPELVASGLLKYFTEYPAHAKYFGVSRGSDGQFDLRTLDDLAHERVIIQLFPV